MQKERRTTSVIICTRDRVPDLLRCLESLQRQTVQPDEIIIVCGSEASCPNTIDALFPTFDFRVLSCFENNISMSRNTGMANSTRDLILFIDDDAVARENWIESYQKLFIEKPNTWIAGGPVFDSRQIPMVYEFNHGLLSSVGLQRPVAELGFRKKGYKPSVKGCNFAISRLKILSVGAFDPFFRFAYDESDLVYTVYHANGSVEYCSNAIVEHAHTPGHYRSTGRMDHDWFVEYASQTMFMLKHSHGHKHFIGYGVLFRRLIKLNATAVYCIARNETSIRQALRCIKDALKGVGDARKSYASRCRLKGVSR